uniref:Uncharacterized protein n=1 Tax=Rhodosorus marinus TaxID=101924 RepID=A0A7S3EKB1_9RHOD|mmetsp:Transcript_40385/g.160364  ORF Transcript_40385/g.160364 Transcript_40385/m.160364 type:complete len:134 (+) Transcript_40385:206-607(+)
MVKAKLIVSIVIRLMLSAVFLMAGTVKLTDKLDENTHEMMLKGFDTYAEMFKIDTLGLNPDQFRVFVGTLEVRTNSWRSGPRVSGWRFLLNECHSDLGDLCGSALVCSAGGFIPAGGGHDWSCVHPHHGLRVQ